MRDHRWGNLHERARNLCFCSQRRWTLLLTPFLHKLGWIGTGDESIFSFEAGAKYLLVVCTFLSKPRSLRKGAGVQLDSHNISSSHNCGVLHHRKTCRRLCCRIFSPCLIGSHTSPSHLRRLCPLFVEPKTQQSGGTAPPCLLLNRWGAHRVHACTHCMQCNQPKPNIPIVPHFLAALPRSEGIPKTTSKPHI